jgi:ubiquinone/menaquinone biosynthesis C-methylase UbiE
MDFASYFYRFMDRVSSRYTINTESVLEIACGTGRNLQYFKTSQLLCGLDISPEMLNSAKLNTPNGFQPSNLWLDISSPTDISYLI